VAFPIKKIVHRSGKALNAIYFLLSFSKAGLPERHRAKGICRRVDPKTPDVY
jgi:hypothetical protein